MENAFARTRHQAIEFLTPTKSPQAYEHLYLGILDQTLGRVACA